MYEESKVMATIGTSLVQESTRDRIVRQKNSLLDRIKDIDRALKLLEKNPELEELQDLLRRI